MTPKCGSGSELICDTFRQNLTIRLRFVWCGYMVNLWSRMQRGNLKKAARNHTPITLQPGAINYRPARVNCRLQPVISYVWSICFRWRIDECHCLINDLLERSCITGFRLCSDCGAALSRTLEVGVDAIYFISVLFPIDHWNSQQPSEEQLSSETVSR